MNFRDYFQAYDKYFWRWEDNAEVITVIDGSTIGYTTQTAKYLTSLAEKGLPTFGSFLMAMAATNNTIDNSVELIKKHLTNYCNNNNATNFLKSDEFKDAFSFLNTLSQIPNEFKKGKRREIILQTIFTDSHNKLNIATSKGLAANLSQNIISKKINYKLKYLNEGTLKKDLRVLHLLRRKYPNPKAIINAIADIPILEEDEIPPLENNIPSNKEYKDFVEELIQVPQTFQIGTLIKPIWAGFKIPIFNAHPSEQPLGGVSDLSNKGDFDKLLVSEFANEDLVFMARLANNEALYLHREMPPVIDKMERVLLLDVSLYSWGTPKILAFAVYLAISKHPKHLNELNAFVVGNNYTSISNQNIGEIIDGLQKVDANLNAAKGLNSYFSDQKNNKLLEVFFITTHEALQQTEIQKLLVENNNVVKYIITTNKEGSIDFYSNKKNGRKHLQRIVLPLEKLWKKPDRFIEEKSSEVIATTQIPLFLPIPDKITKLIPFENDVFIVANKCLLKIPKIHYEKRSKGAELLLQNITKNELYEIGRDEIGDLIFLEFTVSNQELRIHHIANKQIAKGYFPHWQSKPFKQFIIHYNRFNYLVYNPDAFSFYPNFETKTIATEKEHYTSNIFFQKYSKRVKEIEDIPKITTQFNYLKKINQVFISKDGFLFFNGHQLLLRYDNQLQLVLNRVKKENTISADYNRNSKSFLFEDGSEILNSNNGYFELKSSNKTIPSIFISSTIEKIIGTATFNYFAGNPFYFNDEIGKVSLLLKDAGTNIIKTIQIIKVHSTLGLSILKELVDNAPQVIPEKYLPNKAEEIVQLLASNGAIASIQSANHTVQQNITQDKFYNDFIAKFIKHIIENATKN